MFRGPLPSSPKSDRSITLNKPLEGLARRLQPIVETIAGIAMGDRINTKHHVRNGILVRSRHQENIVANMMLIIMDPNAYNRVFPIRRYVRLEVNTVM